MRNIRRKMEAEAAAKRALVEHDTEEKLDMNFSVKRFDDTRGRLVIEFFVSHFLLLAKKSNENRAYGQGLMYLLQVENLLRLLNELKLHGSASHMEFQTELEQLKQVGRGDMRDYWNLAWGQDERAVVHGSFKMNAGPGGAASKEQSQPLPKVPSYPKSPIPGTEAKAEGVNRISVTAEING